MQRSGIRGEPETYFSDFMGDLNVGGRGVSVIGNADFPYPAALHTGHFGELLLLVGAIVASLFDPVDLVAT